MLHPIIKGYYENKSKENYDMKDIEAIVAEYGEDYMLDLIRRACKKKHEAKKPKTGLKTFLKAS